MFRRSSEVPSTPFQRLIWAEQRVAANQAIANIGVFAHVAGGADEQALLEAVRLAVAESDALRTRIRTQGESVVLDIEEHAEIRSEVVDFRDDPSSLTRARADAEGRARTAMPLFDCPLVEVVVYRVGLQDSAVYLSVHHLVGDATSMLVLSRSAIAYYEHLVGFSQQTTGRVIGSYRDWSNRQNEYLSSAPATRLLDSVVTQLQAVPAGGLLGMLPRGRESAGARITRNLDERTTSALRGLLKGLGGRRHGHHNVRRAEQASQRVRTRSGGSAKSHPRGARRDPR